MAAASLNFFLSIEVVNNDYVQVLALQNFKHYTKKNYISHNITRYLTNNECIGFVAATHANIRCLYVPQKQHKCTLKFFSVKLAANIDCRIFLENSIKKK